MNQTSPKKPCAQELKLAVEVQSEYPESSIIEIVERLRYAAFLYFRHLKTVQRLPNEGRGTYRVNHRQVKCESFLAAFEQEIIEVEEKGIRESKKAMVPLSRIKEKYTDSSYEIGETRVHSSLHGARQTIDGGRHRKV